MAVSLTELLLIAVVITTAIILFRRYRRRRFEEQLTRVLAVIRARGGKASIDDIIMLGGLSPSTAKKALAALHDKGLVNIMEEGKTIYYTIG